MTLLATFPDSRDPRGRQHQLATILAVGLAAVLAGARSFVAIGEWVAHQPHPRIVSVSVSVARGPGESTIRRAFGRLQADTFDLVLGAYLWTPTIVTDGRRVIALDGKIVRGARTSSTLAYLLTAYAHTAGTVLQQVAIPALRGSG